jgi:hypothetical protein
MFRSESRVEALVRPAMGGRLQRRAEGTSGSNAASRWGTPDLTTPVRAVAKSGVGAVQVGIGHTGIGMGWDGGVLLRRTGKRRLVVNDQPTADADVHWMPARQPTARFRDAARV